MEDQVISPTFRNSLKSQGILVDFDGGFYNWTRRDQTVEKEVSVNHNVSATAGRYLKNIFLGCDANFHRIRQLIQAARKDHELQTVAWEKDLRLLLNRNFMLYTQTQQRHKIALDTAKSLLEAAYDKLVHDAAGFLGALHNPKDYPSKHEVLDACFIKHTFRPIADASDVRMELDPDVVSQIQAQVTQSQQDQFDKAVNSTWERFASIVEQMTRNLGKNPNGKGTGVTGDRFRTEWWDSLSEFLPVLEGLNLGDDPRLTALASRCKSLLTTEPDDYKASPSTRAAAYRKAQAIFDDLSAIYSPQTGVK